MTLHLRCALMSKCMHAVAHMGHIHTYEHIYVSHTCRHTHSKERTNKNKTSQLFDLNRMEGTQQGCNRLKY